MFLSWIVLKKQAEAGYWHNGSVVFVHHMCIEARSLGVMICIVSQDHSRNGAGCSFFAANQVVPSELQQLPDEFCIAVCCIHWSNICMLAENQPLLTEYFITIGSVTITQLIYNIPALLELCRKDWLTMFNMYTASLCLLHAQVPIRSSAWTEDRHVSHGAIMSGCLWCQEL